MKKEEVLTVRLSNEDMAALDALAKEKGVSRATMARTILANSRRLYNYLESLGRGATADDIKLAEDIAINMQKQFESEEITPDVADTMSKIMLNAITQLSEKMSEKKNK
jgi:predicted transcriptional regulator